MGLNLQEGLACLPLAFDLDGRVGDGETQALAWERLQGGATQFTVLDLQAAGRQEGRHQAGVRTWLAHGPCFLLCSLAWHSTRHASDNPPDVTGLPEADAAALPFFTIALTTL